MKKLVVIVLMGCLALNSFSKEIRDVLQKEAKEAGLSQALIKNYKQMKRALQNFVTQMSHYVRVTSNTFKN